MHNVRIVEKGNRRVLGLDAGSKIKMWRRFFSVSGVVKTRIWSR